MQKWEPKKFGGKALQAVKKERHLNCIFARQEDKLSSRSNDLLSSGLVDGMEARLTDSSLRRAQDKRLLFSHRQGNPMHSRTTTPRSDELKIERAGIERQSWGQINTK